MKNLRLGNQPLDRQSNLGLPNYKAGFPTTELQCLVASLYINSVASFTARTVAVATSLLLSLYCSLDYYLDYIMFAPISLICWVS
jgi:hypothetical protein